MNGDEDLGQDIIMKGEKFHYAENSPKTNSTAAGRYDLAQEQNVQLEWDNPVQGPAEGVLFPQTGHSEHHTTYYAKKSPEVAFIETEGEPGTPVEGVHVLAPIPHQTTFTGPSEFAYPNQRTTFYAQTGAVQFDQQNGLWRSFAQVDPIGPTNYDPWVYETSRDGMGAQVQHAQQQARAQVADTINPKGYDPKVFEFTQDIISRKNPDFVQQDFDNGLTQKKTKDIAEPGYEPNVYHFLKPLTNPLNVKDRSDSPPPLPNGHANTYAQRDQKKKDIGEKGVDEEVHGFVSAYTPPLQNRREEQPYAPNGSDPSSHVERKKKDIGEKGVDEEVHGFVSAYTPPL